LLITVIVAEESEASSKAFAGKRKKIATRANVERTRDRFLDELGNSGPCSAAPRFDASEQRRRDCRYGRYEDRIEIKLCREDCCNRASDNAKGDLSLY